jgi:transaldolase
MSLQPVSVCFKSPLHQMTQTTATCLWNDSPSLDELAYSIDHGAVGATCNPVIVYSALKRDLQSWKPRIIQLINEMPLATAAQRVPRAPSIEPGTQSRGTPFCAGLSEDQIAWRIIEEVSINGAEVLKPIFDAHKGVNGRLSIQTDPHFYRDTAAIVEQAVRFSRLAPNMIVKIPVTRAGIPAIEEATYRGVSINATVSFTLPQSIAVAEAVERGLKRREREGLDIASMGPVCTIMVGRLDDWLKVDMERRAISTDPGYLEWAGVAVFKKAYAIFRERGYRIRLLSAAFRNHMHWSEFIGGDVVISPPCAWQRRYNASDIEVKSRIDTPVEPRIVDDLLKRFPDFHRAYMEDGLTVDEFDSFPCTRRTLRQFIEACADLASLVRDVMLPNPDAK